MWPLGKGGQSKMKVKMVPMRSQEALKLGGSRGWVIHVDPDVTWADAGMECKMLNISNPQ